MRAVSAPGWMQLMQPQAIMLHCRADNIDTVLYRSISAPLVCTGLSLNKTRVTNTA